jgi:hypothetical protein
MNQVKNYFVFGDLHGRILPAVKLAAVWSREHDKPVEGILQVGDLGYFPDLSRLDKATIRHAKDDPTELGAQDIIEINELADEIFNDPHCPGGLWFTAGNHEDFEALESLASSSGGEPDFAVDVYGKIRCIKDGGVVTFQDQVRVGALWGVDGEKDTRRKKLDKRGYIRGRSVERLAASEFDVLITHDAPADAKRVGYGSDFIRLVIDCARPKFAFFGHYHGEAAKSVQDFGETAVYHMGGMEMHGRDGCAETGSVGLLKCSDGELEFEYLSEEWLRTFTRHNWRYR